MSAFLLVKIALAVGAIAILVVRWLRRRGRSGQAADPEIMKALRLEVLENVPEDVDSSVGADQPLLIVMDIGTPAGAASIVSATTGDASIYLTSGGGLLGGIGHENVRKAAVEFVREAANHRSEMARTSDYPYPADGYVRFYVRTLDGVYATKERSEDALGEKQDPLWPLFYAGQNVISQFRIVAPEFGR